MRLRLLSSFRAWVRAARSGTIGRALAGVLVVAVPAAAMLPQPVFARPAPDSFAGLAHKLLPTVVNIATEQTLKTAGTRQLPDLPPGSPLQDLFKDFLDKNRNAPRHVTSLGSGFIIDPS
jgi:serine protease Do